MSDFPRKPGDRTPENNTDENVFDPTIVGGRPSARSQLLKGIHRGIEVLIKKASVDPEFRTILMKKRAEAAAEIELELSATEAAMLNAIPRAQIEKIIENTTVPDVHRRLFLGKIAAAMLSVLGFPLSGGCAGIRPGPHWPIMPQGTRPDLPGTHKLRIKPIEKGNNRVDIVVAYECPFDKGELTIAFRSDVNSYVPQITCQPSKIPVVKGKGEATFHAIGTSEDTRWLQARLSNADDDCVQKLAGISRTSVRCEAGEDILDDCLIVNTIQYNKVWS